MLGETIKKMAKESVARGMPADFVFGVVTAINPVIIRIEDRFDIFEEFGQIVIPKEFRPMQSYPTHYHTGMANSPTTASASGGSGEDSFASHVHQLKSNYTTNMGEGSEVYYGLKVGEKVVLFRKAGGQSYLVMGRM